VNYNVSTTWLLKDMPSADTLWHDADEGDGQDEGEGEQGPLPMNLADAVEPFQITLPLLLIHNATPLIRDFPGGTVLDLLQFIYAFYQEPMPLEELVEIQRTVRGSSSNRLAGLRQRLEAGELVRRLDVVGRASTFEGIANGVLLLD
jgi:hypothetical protein